MESAPYTSNIAAMHMEVALKTLAALREMAANNPRAFQFAMPKDDNDNPCNWRRMLARYKAEIEFMERTLDFE